jgi:hypothetical protein
MKGFRGTFVKFLKSYFVFHLVLWLFLLIVGNKSQLYSGLFAIWFGGTIILPILLCWYFVLFRGGEFEGSFRILFHSNLGVPYYTLLLCVVFAGFFVTVLYCGWQIARYLYDNKIISNDFVILISICSLFLAVSISFFMLKKISDYLYLHGY